MHTPHPTPWIRPWTQATETIKRVWHISVTWASLVLFFFNKRQRQKGGIVPCLLCRPPKYVPPRPNMLLSRSLRLGACERIISLFKES